MANHIVADERVQKIIRRAFFPASPHQFRIANLGWFGQADALVEPLLETPPHPSDFWDNRRKALSER